MAGDAIDMFSWSAPNANGIPITKYGYQTSTDNGSTWSSETEVLTTSAVLNTQYSTSSFRIRVRAFNAAGWGEYSNISTNGTLAWTANTGTDTQTDTVCGPAGCSSTDSESTETDCDSCGVKTRTRSMSRTSSRTRTRSTLFYSRSGSTSSSITYGSYGAWSDYTYSAWSYGAWGDYGPCSGFRAYYTDSGVLGGISYTRFTDTWTGAAYVRRTDDGTGGCGCDSYYAWQVSYCTLTGEWRHTPLGCVQWTPGCGGK